ncbi:MAG: hypothetical protein PHX14_12585, partial [Syntrophomonadaceae bacterium]|nr:hypothetical protein [Syntrophomonadaceae bacterium]
PWINHRYVFYLATRYIMPLNICALLLIAAAVVYLLQAACAKFKNSRLVITPASLVLGLFIIMQLFPFYNYCRQNSNTNLSNQLALQIMSVINSYGREKTLVLLDENLPLENAPLPYLLTVSQQNYLSFKSKVSSGSSEALDWASLLERCGKQKLLIVMNQDTYLSNQSQILNLHKHIFKTRVVFPGKISEERIIYLVEMTSRPQKASMVSSNANLAGYAAISK